MNLIGVPPGESFFDAVVAHFLAAEPAARDVNDFSAVRVLVPALPLAAELRAALSSALRHAALLPEFGTLRQWAQTAAVAVTPLPGSRRQVLLYEALRARQWFDEAALWSVAAEMAALFDELSEASVQLPDDAASLAAQLESAYAVRASLPLAFEARVVHELWRALTASGEADTTAVYRRQLAELAREPSQDLFVLLDAAPEEALAVAEYEFLKRYAERRRVHIVYPLPRESAATPLLATLAAAWPQTSETLPHPPLRERAQAVAQRYRPSPLAERLALMPAAGREPEAQAAVAQIGAWLQAGVRRIALIAQDRLTARRVRALLEGEGILVSDETGWLLSTSRAAAAVDALIETIAGGAYHRDLLDLCKAPFVFADIAEPERQAAVFALETAIRGASVTAGLTRFRRAVSAGEGADKEKTLDLLDRVAAADALLGGRPATLARWLVRLHRALEALGMLSALADDIAGRALLDLLEIRHAELAGNDAVFSLGAWRDWLNRELEVASFRDARVVSPIVVTPLNAVCLRRFEAALLVGGDARQLSPAASNAFFNQSVRRELGLRTHADGERALRRDLELLLTGVPRVTVTWQSVQDGEARLPAPELLLLSTLHALAWGDDLHRPLLPSRPVAGVDAATAPGPTQAAAPIAPPMLIPQRVSVSGYASLVACPYRFFARHVLRLGEMDEVSEEMEKRDYGNLVHRVLERFHRRHPLVSALGEAEALSALQACVDEIFAPAIGENFLAAAWRLRWARRLPAYLAWQRAREAEGWRWAQAETPARRALPLAGGGRVELYGRIDRIDTRHGGDEAALLDYKTQTVKAIRQRLDEDVQMPAYALMHDKAGEAAYVALDDENVTTVPGGDGHGSLAEQGEAQGQRLIAVFDALHAGARLPAHGADSVCLWCEMSGLCRKALLA